MNRLPSQILAAASEDITAHIARTTRSSYPSVDPDSATMAIVTALDIVRQAQLDVRLDAEHSRSRLWALETLDQVAAELRVQADRGHQYTLARLVARTFRDATDAARRREQTPTDDDTR